MRTPRRNRLWLTPIIVGLMVVASLVCLSVASSVLAAPPADGDQVCVSGAGNATVNGTYTYNGGTSEFEKAGIRMLFYAWWAIEISSGVAAYETGLGETNDMTTPALTGADVWNSLAEPAPAPTVQNGACGAATSAPAPAPAPAPVPQIRALVGWNVAGSLETLVAQIGLGWWPGMAPPENIGIEIHVGNPLEVGWISGNLVNSPVTLPLAPVSNNTKEE